MWDNRLTEANYSNGDYYHYAYDAVGNRETQITFIGGLPSTTNYIYDDANRLTSVNAVNYTWDNNGNASTRSARRLLNDGVTAYTYDSASYAQGVFDGGSAFRLGDRGNNLYSLDGSLDEVAIYKRALSAAERTWLYNNGAGRAYTELSGTPSVWYPNNYTYSPTIPHAVTSVNRVNFTDTFTYDANGNMTCRVESGVTYKQDYNAENRIASIIKLPSGTCTTPNYANAIQWDFAYDGDGVRTSQGYTPYDTNGNPQTLTLTRYYFGGALEISGSMVKKYYSFAGQTVAMKEGSTFKYFLSDHLGSISLVLDDDSSTILEQQRYLPFGQPRAMAPAISSTDFTYTGQRALPNTGLMDYKARFYSPYLNHFTQPDSIVPNLYNPQSLNRYAYALNNPIRFNDPTGHSACDQIPPGPGRIACESGGYGVAQKQLDLEKDYKSGKDPCLGFKGINHDICQRGKDRPEHDYTSGPHLVCPAELNCTQDEMAEYLTHFAYPGQDPSQTVKDLQTNHVGFCIIKSLCIPMDKYGTIWTDISDDHLTVINHTIRPHIFADGQVIRHVYQQDDAWYITTHSTGAHIYPFMAQANQWFGPGIFDTADQAMLEYALANH